MKLFINTADKNTLTIGLGGNNYVLNGRNAQEILPNILNILHAGAYSLESITEIEVHTGPGSYTGLRVGCAIANTLGYALKIPVNHKTFPDIAVPHY